MTEKTPLTGGCLCGRIRFETSGMPRHTSYCHCGMCRRSTGGPFAVYADFPRQAVRFIKGSPKVFASSRVAERGFCPDCGTPLSFRYLDSERLSLTVGSFDQPACILPDAHDGIEGRLPWVSIDDALPQRETELDPALL